VLITACWCHPAVMRLRGCAFLGVPPAPPIGGRGPRADLVLSRAGFAGRAGTCVRHGGPHRGCGTTRR
ncbi:unnamed protein product, partial [Coccothraustes coccothraustes]